MSSSVDNRLTDLVKDAMKMGRSYMIDTLGATYFKDVAQQDEILPYYSLLYALHNKYGTAVYDSLKEGLELVDVNTPYGDKFISSKNYSAVRWLATVNDKFWLYNVTPFSIISSDDTDMLEFALRWPSKHRSTYTTMWIRQAFTSENIAALKLLMEYTDLYSIHGRIQYVSKYLGKDWLPVRDYFRMHGTGLLPLALAYDYWVPLTWCPATHGVLYPSTRSQINTFAMASMFATLKHGLSIELLHYIIQCIVDLDTPTGEHLQCTKDTLSVMIGKTVH